MKFLFFLILMREGKRIFFASFFHKKMIIKIKVLEIAKF